MILIDAIYINSGGGRILLNYLIMNLEKSNLKVHYLFDNRIEANHPKIKSSNLVTYSKASLFDRLKIYNSFSNEFSKIFCFGNLPPIRRNSAEVITYFHQSLFINCPTSLPFREKLIIRMKMAIIQLIKRNSDKWLVQSEEVRKGLINKYKLKEGNVLTVPFFPTLESDNTVTSKKNTFVYVSSAGLHKNHERLIKGFCLFFDKHKTGELGLTISEKQSFEINLIKNLTKKGYPIKNYGFVNRTEVSKIYSSTEYLVFPSLKESFGLGIVEAIEGGCKVISADLPYTYSVCLPSLTFDPLSVSDIALAFEKSLKENIKQTEKVICNEIEYLINILK